MPASVCVCPLRLRSKLLEASACRPVCWAFLVSLHGSLCPINTLWAANGPPRPWRVADKRRSPPNPPSCALRPRHPLGLSGSHLCRRGGVEEGAEPGFEGLPGAKWPVRAHTGRLQAVSRPLCEAGVQGVCAWPPCLCASVSRGARALLHRAQLLAHLFGPFPPSMKEERGPPLSTRLS